MSTVERRLRRMRRCELDLKRNGIDLADADVRATRLLVRRHLDYFQLMLGYDAGPGEVIALENRLRRRRDDDHTRRAGAPRHPAAGA